MGSLASQGLHSTDCLDHEINMKYSLVLIFMIYWAKATADTCYSCDSDTDTHCASDDYYGNHYSEYWSLACRTDVYDDGSVKRGHIFKGGDPACERFETSIDPNWADRGGFMRCECDGSNCNSNLCE